MPLSYVLIAYFVLAAILVLVSLFVLMFTWRFRYLGRATYVIVAIFITTLLVNGFLTAYYVLRTDWAYDIGFTLTF